MTDRTEQEKHMLTRLHKQMQRPGQAPADGPYWIVMNLSVHKELKYSPPRALFRHPTEAGANRECDRLAALPHNVGKRFGVFGSTGHSAKIEVDSVPEPAREPDMQAA